MTKTIQFFLTLVAAALLSLGNVGAQDSSPLATEEVIKKDLETLVCKNDERLDADSSSLKDIKIPSISIHGLDNKWNHYLHSSDDKVENVNATSVYFGYRYGLRFASRAEKAVCRELGPAK